MEMAEYIRLPARTVVFNQGDIGEKMYIIVKGRVAVEKRSIEYGYFPLVVALLRDGEHFGELGLIDQDKLDKSGTHDLTLLNEATLLDGN